MDLDTLNGLSACPLFKGFTDEEIMQTMHGVRYRVHRYRRGEVFMMAGEKCQHANILIAGDVSASMTGPSGRIISLSMHHSGNMLAPAFLFSADTRYPVTVEALSDTHLLRLQAADMEALIQSDSRIARNYIGILANIVSFLTRKVSMLSMSVREKVEHFFREEQKRQQSNELHLNMTRQALAEQFGIQKFSLQRCLKEMQEEGLIRMEGKIVYLLK